MARPDLKNKERGLAVWIKEEDGDVVLSINKNGEYIGSIRDFNNFLGLKKQWYLYILKAKGYGKNNSGDVIFYVGSTWNLKKRLREHKYHKGSEFLRKYKYKAVSIEYFEVFDTQKEAREREKEVKEWSRNKKIKKIKEFEHPLTSSGELSAREIR